MKTSHVSCGRVFLVILIIGSYIPLPGCGSNSTSTAEYSLPDDVKAEIKARKEKAKAEAKIKSKRIRTH
jgi:hypothetical protein